MDGLPLRATALRSSAASDAAPPFVIPNTTTGVSRSQALIGDTPLRGMSPQTADTALPPIGVATKDGIAWMAPVYGITLQVSVCFFEKAPFSTELYTDTNPLQVTVLITFDPSHPDLNHGIVCINNPLVYVDPSGHDFGLSLLIGAAIGALLAGVQSDWNPQAMAIGAGIGAISGGVASFASGAATSGLLAQVVENAWTGQVYSAIGYGTVAIGGAAAGGAAGGAVAGGLYSGVYGGNVLEGMAYGALGGGIMGGVMGAIGHYGRGLQANSWQPGDPGSSNRPDPMMTAGPGTRTPLTADEGQAVVDNLSKKWQGIPYKYGGNSQSGIDCSHLVHRGFAGAGFDYPYAPAAGIPNTGHFTSAIVNLQPADVAIWNIPKIQHALVYAPGGPNGMDVITAHRTGGAPSGWDYLSRWTDKYGPPKWYRYVK